ncbi:MAG: LamG-like jellyroll fold domain-containing protein [Anaerohalosphaeraceae bacterium]
MNKSKWFLYFLFGFGISGLSSAVLVDDFDEYLTGPVDTVTTDWKGIASPSLAVIQLDPLNPDNKALGVTESNNNNGVYGILSGDAIVENGQTKTLFLRILTTVSSPTAPNTAFGLIDLDVPPANCWSSISTFVRINNGGIQARDGSAANWGPSRPITANTWYNVWIVVNHATKRFELYVNTGPGNATPADKVGDSYAFRAVHNNALDRFVTQSQGTSQILFDDIHISPGTDLTNKALPFGAHNPVPADKAANIPLNTMLTWNTGVDPLNPANPNPLITKHYVYFREGDPNLAAVSPMTVPASGNPTDSCYPPIPLAMDKTYYWRVDESVNDSSPTDPNTIRGSVWSFETVRSIPAIVQQPSSVQVFPSETASFTVLFTSVAPPTVVWMKSDGIQPDTPIASGGRFTITTGLANDVYNTTLTITETEQSDQAWYYCLLTNGPAPAVQSDSAGLVIKKLLAHYEFENNFLDSVGTHHGIGRSADPNSPAGPVFVDGIVGSRAVFFNGINQYIELDASAYPNGGLGGGMNSGTISCWVKAVQPGMLYSNYNDNLGTTGLTGYGLSLTAGAASNARIHVRGQTGTGTPADVGAAEGRPAGVSTMIDSQWHHIAAAWQTGGRLIVYVDGVQVASATAGSPAVFAPWERSSIIGAIRTAADRTILGSFYGGALDDLRIYNYVLDNYAVADLYYAGSGRSACIEPYASGFDYDRNCRVDLGDLAALAAAWLDCGLYPQCRP